MATCCHGSGCSKGAHMIVFDWNNWIGTSGCSTLKLTKENIIYCDNELFPWKECIDRNFLILFQRSYYMLVAVSSAYYYNFSTSSGIFDKVNFRMQVEKLWKVCEASWRKKSSLSPPPLIHPLTHTSVLPTSCRADLFVWSIFLCSRRLLRQ